MTERQEEVAIAIIKGVVWTCALGAIFVIVRGVARWMS